MKRLLALAAMGMVLTIVGCTLFQAMDVTAEWVPRTASVDTYWRLYVSAHVSQADSTIPHKWEIDWGDGAVDAWAKGERNWPKYPDDHTRVATVHEYVESGTYSVTVKFEDRLCQTFNVDVGAM